MPHHDHLRMSQQELSMVPIFTQLAQRQFTQHDAARMLGLSTRQVKRKLRVFRKRGPQSLIHKLRGRPGNHQLPAGLKDRALNLIQRHYPDFGPTFAAEKLSEHHQVVIHHETLRLLMIDQGLWRPGFGAVTPHLWRERKEAFGELIQVDGSVHRWFEDRKSPSTLLAFIDDATSQLLWLEFAEAETTEALMRSSWHYLEQFGRPISLYADRGGVFSVNLNNPEHDRLTQYGRALKELDIELIPARSPQAKGRVERVFGTLQDRLVKELRLRGISTIDEADHFVQTTYLSRHNAKFAVAPKRAVDFHRSLEGYDLARIFCVKEQRRVANDLTLSYRKRLLQLSPQQPTIVSPGTVVTVEESLSGQLTLFVRRSMLSFKEILERPQRPAATVLRKPRTPWIPPPNHPWRQSFRVTVLSSGTR